MKNSETMSATADTQMQERISLFKSIVDNEKLQEKELECQRLANRVGLIKKILVNRNLDVLSWEFDNKLNELIEDFANRIDNELYPTQKDS